MFLRAQRSDKTDISEFQVLSVIQIKYVDSVWRKSEFHYRSGMKFPFTKIKSRNNNDTIRPVSINMEVNRTTHHLGHIDDTLNFLAFFSIQSNMFRPHSDCNVLLCNAIFFKMFLLVLRKHNLSPLDTHSILA